MRRLAFTALTSSLIYSRIAQAQSGLQQFIPVIASGTSAIPISASEAAYHVKAREMRTQAEVGFRRAYPVDSMSAIATAEGIRWLECLQQGPVRGIQLDPASGVGVVANAEVYAKQQIADRLATPGLSFADKAFTYRSAVIAFSSAYYPARLPIAEAYLQALDAMGDSAAAWQFEARRSLVDTYYQLGRAADVVRLGTRAIQLVNIMPFADRDVMFEDGIPLYNATAEALAGMAGGSERIARLQTWLRAATIPAPAVVASNPWFSIRGKDYLDILEQLATVGGRLGKLGNAVIANHWLNRPSRDSQAVAVNDGKVRVLEMGTYGCPPCILALYGMERLHATFPDVEFLMSTYTAGSWGNRLIGTQEEVERLTDYFLNVARVTIPIGIWAPPKAANADGGVTPEEHNPNWAGYPFGGKPMIWVLDGKGTIRRVFIGYSREIEEQIAKTVQFLQHESVLTRDTVPTAH